jgi:hypothetical protein
MIASADKMACVRSVRRPDEKYSRAAHAP